MRAQLLNGRAVQIDDPWHSWAQGSPQCRDLGRPRDASRTAAMCCHVHPPVRLNARGGQYIRSPSVIRSSRS